MNNIKKSPFKQHLIFPNNKFVRKVLNNLDKEGHMRTIADLEKIWKYDEKFKSLICDKFKIEKEEEVSNFINNGYCHLYAAYILSKVNFLNNPLEIVQSNNSNHWFLRMLDGDDYIYIDAFISAGTPFLLDIVDQPESHLVKIQDI